MFSFKNLSLKISQIKLKTLHVKEFLKVGKANKRW